VIDGCESALRCDAAIIYDVDENLMKRSRRSHPVSSGIGNGNGNGHRHHDRHHDNDDGYGISSANYAESKSDDSIHSDDENSQEPPSSHNHSKHPLQHRDQHKNNITLMISSGVIVSVALIAIGYRYYGKRRSYRPIHDRYEDAEVSI
jgi:hypothetical protein